MLPLISELICFRLIDPDIDSEALMSRLPISNLQTLSIPILDSVFNSIYEIVPIRNLSVSSSSSLNKLCQLLQCATTIQYLNVSNIRKEFDRMYCEKILSDYHAVHLKHLTMIDFECDLNVLIYFVKHTPNLKSLTIST
jgi:hypothetical protein